MKVILLFGEQTSSEQLIGCLFGELNDIGEGLSRICNINTAQAFFGILGQHPFGFLCEVSN